MRIFAVFAVLALSGCASVFPREQSTRRAELAWQAVNGIDTLQTIQIAKHPECYRERNPVAAAIYGSDHPDAGRVAVTNIALALVHARVSRWFDDGVARSFANEDGSEALWTLGRIGWWGASFFGTGTAVVGNFTIGLHPTSARCP